MPGSSIRHAVTFLLFVAGLLMSTSVVGQEKSSIRFENGYLNIEGPVRPLADQVFVNEFASAMFATPHPEPIRLRLNSDGGGLEATKTIIQAIRAAQREDTRIVAEVPPGGHCMSACILIFAAADERLAASDATFLFHGIVYTGLDHSPEKLADIEQQRGEAAREYLDMIAASDARLGRFLETNHVIDRNVEIAFTGADLHRGFPEFVTGLTD